MSIFSATFSHQKTNKPLQKTLLQLADLLKVACRFQEQLNARNSSLYYKMKPN